MSWSKVTSPTRKPIGWWYHKVMCEICYYFYRSGDGYYYHLDIMCDKYGLNLYGEKYPPFKKGRNP